MEDAAKAAAGSGTGSRRTVRSRVSPRHLMP